MEEGKYRIRIAAEMTGTTAPQLRVWEKRYGIPNPLRSSSRYRLYSDQDVRELKRMRDLVSQGIPPSEAARRVKETRGQASDPGERVMPTRAGLAERTKELMMTAILSYDMRALDEQLNLLLRSGSVADNWSDIIQPLLADIGVAWFNGDLDPAQEHLASNGVRYTLQTMYRLIEPKHAQGVILLACVGGERHDIPLLGLGIEMATLGWRSLMVGADVPADSIRATVGTGVDAVGLSITMPLSTEDTYAYWKEYADGIGSVPWVVGGRSAPLYESEIEALGGHVIRSNEECVAVFKARRKRRP